MKKYWLYALPLLMTAPAQAEGIVMVTLKPLHSLVAGVMHGDGDPQLIVDGAMSEHDFVLKPSQVEAMADADIVFYVSEELETFIPDSIEAIPERVQMVSMGRQQGMEILPTRRGGLWLSDAGTGSTDSASAFSGVPGVEASSATDLLARQWQEQQRRRQQGIESRSSANTGRSYGGTGGIGGVGTGQAGAAQESAQAAYQQWKEQQGDQPISPARDGTIGEGDDRQFDPEYAAAHPQETNAQEEDHDHDHLHGGKDLHLWLSPDNAKRMVDVIASTLSARYPGKQAIYQQNANSLKSHIDMQRDQLRQRLSLLQGKPFVVFHDAYQYFEKAYGLQSIGAVLVRPDRVSGVRHLTRLREAMADSSARCVFSEPQFDDRLMASITEGMNVRTGVLDPLGADLPAGPDLYFQLNEQLAQSMERCIGFN